ncbi:MAG: polyphenol oxidase family protein [Polyangiales bacterium]
MSLALRSSLLAGKGFLHGFSLRTGGVSAPPFAALNLGRAVGDAPEAVAENHRRFAATVGYAAEALREVTQVHGPDVIGVDPGADVVALRAREADALVSVRVPVGVRVADCAAVLLADPRSGAVAALHAGWRGAVAGVVEATVAALCAEVSAARHTLLAALFPCISAAHFEVSEEVAAQLAAAAGTRDVVMTRPGARPHVDLAGTVLRQLARAGLTEANIEHVAGCTFGDGARFFSHRRDCGQTGRHLAAIVPQC